MLPKFPFFRFKHYRSITSLHQCCPGFTKFLHSQNEIRNIGIVAHIDAGKTTTTERILYTSGFSKSVGNVDDGTTIMDFLPEERKRGITIQSAAITFGWPIPQMQTNATNSSPSATPSLCQINLIDTPGHVDFTFEVERSLSVLDGVVTIIDGVAGVQAQTRTVWHQSNQHHLPRLIFLNKLDRVGAKERWKHTFKQIHKQLSSKGPFLLTQLPLFDNDRSTRIQGSGLYGVLDLIQMNFLTWPQGQLESLPMDSASPFFSLLEKHRHVLVEQLCSLNDEVLDTYLETEDALSVPSSLLHQAVSEASKKNRAVPILMGASYRDIGIQPLLDAIVSYLPSPASPQQLSALATSNVYAFVFKVVYDPQRSGYLCYARVYSGRLLPRQTILNRTKNQKERIQRIQMVYADQTEDVPSLGPGSIGILLGLKLTSTGDHLGSTPPSTCSIPNLIIPPPVMTRAIEPNSLKDEPHLQACLTHLHKEDPSIRILEDSETGQRLVSGMGELHLEIIANRLHQLGAQATFGPLTIAYREMLIEDCEEVLEEEEEEEEEKVMEVHSEEGEHSCQTVRLKAWKLSNEEMVSLDLANRLKGDNAQLLETSLNCGPLGYPLINLGLEVLQTGSRVRLHACLMKLLKNRTILVEPTMRVIVRLNGANIYFAKLLGDLAKRKGRILEVHPDYLVAIVPLAQLLGYATALRGLTAGYGTYEMQMEGYTVAQTIN